MATHDNDEEDRPSITETTAQNRILATLRKLRSARAKVRVMRYVSDVVQEELEDSEVEELSPSGRRDD